MQETNAVEETPTEGGPPAAGNPGDGRYDGRNEHAFVDLRVDGAAGSVSADIDRFSPDGGRDWVASVRSAPSTPPIADGSWVVIAEDDLGGHTTGRLSVSPHEGSSDRLDVAIVLDSPLNGLPADAEISVIAERRADAVRSLGVELEVEEGVDWPVQVEFRDRQVTLESCLHEAGFAATRAGTESRIPRGASGWGLSELHTLMQDFAAASLTERLWELHLLILSRSDMQGLLGVMFDETEVLPRQGVAVFADAIRGIPGIDHDRKLIQTTVHELGHALNLAHRFERVVGRADSTSFMNYDWRYRGGDRRDEYWERFEFTFDADELSFLRHGTRTGVIPGGAPFHSVRYWNEGAGGYSPYVPEAPLEGFRLELHPPQAGRLFAFAQPVFLEVELTNLTGQPLELPPVLLDPKGGFLELLVRRTGGTSTRSLQEAEVFSPIVQRCFDIDPTSFDTVGHGDSIRNNVNLTYGSSGFPFAEPGAYEVTALLAVYDRANDQELIVRSEPLPIRVATPQSVEEDRDAMDLFRDDVGVYLALGGNRALTGAREALGEVVERRGAEVHDPVVASIVRAQAIDAGRSHLRYEQEQFREEGADPAQAADLLGRLDDAALQAFDADTADGTRRLAERYRS
jgi:hypothetical protein